MNNLTCAFGANDGTSPGAKPREKATMRFIILAILLGFLSLADAGSISRGGGSFSSAGRSAPARSMGYQRPSVVPSRPPVTTTPVPRTSTYVAPAPVTVTHAAAPSGGGGFWSSAAGGFTGSLLGNMISTPHAGTTVVTSPGAVAPAAVAAPSVTAVAPTWSLWGLLSDLIAILLIGALLYAAWRGVQFVRVQRRARAADVPFSPVRRFIDVQTAFARCDKEALRTLLGPNIVDQSLADLPAEVSEMKLTGISFEVRANDGESISIHYRADDDSDGSKLNEVWHFRSFNGVYLLDGIEPV